MRPKRPIIVAVDRKYEGNRISLRVDRARFENGPAFDREIVEHPGSVVVIPITKNGKILLVRQYRIPAERDLLEVSAGTIEKGESPDITAHRELQEEVGYKAGTLTSIGGSWVAPGYSTEYTHTYLATDLVPSVLPSDDGEDIVVEEVSFEDLDRLISTGELEDQMSIAALLIAKYVYKAIIVNKNI